MSPSEIRDPSGVSVNTEPHGSGVVATSSDKSHAQVGSQATQEGAASKKTDAANRQQRNRERKRNNRHLRNKEFLSVERAEPALPKFIVISRKEGDFSKVSPFLIDKLLAQIISSKFEVKKINEGLLVECTAARQIENLLKTTQLGDFEVDIKPHGTLNTSKGVIVCRDLLNSTIEEIREGLKSQGVVDVRRMTTKHDGMVM